MKKSKLQIVSSNGKSVDKPEAESLGIPKHMKLNGPAKKIYESLVERIADQVELKEFHSEMLAMIATEIESWVWANQEIKKKNRKHAGSGYVQVFRTGATNITTEMVVRNTALKNFESLSKKFGLTTKDYKELGANDNPMQLELFTQLLQANS